MTPWGDRSLAFATVALLHEFVAFQDHFERPSDADLATLTAQKQALETFVKHHRGAPHIRDTARRALTDLRSEIADRRFWRSRRGSGLAEVPGAGPAL